MSFNYFAAGRKKIPKPRRRVKNNGPQRRGVPFSFNILQKGAGYLIFRSLCFERNKKHNV